MDPRQQQHQHHHQHPHQQPPPPPQPQGANPFARTIASPPAQYRRSPFPPAQNSANSAHFPPPASHSQSHPPSASPAPGAYGGPGPDHQRRLSTDSHPYFSHQQSRTPFERPDPTSHPGAPTHSRHQSASSIGGPPSRNMGPPSDPPQQQPMGPYSMQQTGPGPAPASGLRIPPPTTNSTTMFSSGRELPSLSSLARTAGMPLSNMLGGHAVQREPTPGSHPPGHAPFPPPSTTPGPSGPGPAYAATVHASPRMQSAAVADYPPFSRRPETPTNHARPYEPRDQRGSVAGSPPQGFHGTPEMSTRYGTPGAHSVRGPPMPPFEDRRDQSGRLSAGSLPPRPSSQPRAFGNGPGRSMEMGRGPPPGEPYFGPRREELRPGQEYNPEGPPRSIYEQEQRRVMEQDREYRDRMERDAHFREREHMERERMERARFEEHQRLQQHQQQQPPPPQHQHQPPFMTEREHMDRVERERIERERQFDMRDRERRERTSSDPNRHGRPVDFGPQGPPGSQGPPSYGREIRDHRDAAGWQLRPGYDQAPARGSYEPAYAPRHGPPEHPVTSGPPFGSFPAHATQHGERYPHAGAASHPPSHAIPVTQSERGPQPFGSPDRHRFVPMPAHHQSQQPPHRVRHDEERPPPPSVAYNGGPGPAVSELPRQPRSLDDGHPAPTLARQQSSSGFLAIGEINRKGRVSPLPQAVQGAQPQSMTPSGEPGIKSEFGRMFSGIGAGAGAYGMPSPGPSHLPFTNSGLARRDDTDPLPAEVNAEQPAKQPRKRQRKVKDDDQKGDDDSTGRLTPVGRTKRARTNHAHHHHHHHHHHHGIPERTASPLHAGSTPLKNVKTGTPVLSPTGLPMTHSHQIPRSSANAINSNNGVAPAKQTPQAPVVFIKPKKTVDSQMVLDSVAHKPRKHLGDILYEPEIKADHFRTHSKGGFRTKPKPLPRDLIQDNENSTLTVKIHRRHLEPHCREELTRNRAVWGTDIYTDDSDVVAACIHGGWFRGEWAEEVDISLLGLERPLPKAKGRGGNAGGEKGSQDTLASPPATGPMHVPLDRDLHVTILILPNLIKYAGTTRFGIMSRDFGGSYKGRRSIHDGLSFKIEQVRWVDGAAPQSRLRGKARRERIRKAMSEVDRSQVIDIGGLKKMDKPAEPPSTTNGDVDKENRPMQVEIPSPAQETREAAPEKPAGAQEANMDSDMPTLESEKTATVEVEATEAA